MQVLLFFGQGVKKTPSKYNSIAGFSYVRTLIIFPVMYDFYFLIRSIYLSTVSREGSGN